MAHEAKLTLPEELLEAEPQRWFQRRTTLLATALPGLVYALIFFSRVGDLGLYVDDWGHMAQVAIQPFSQYARSWPFDYRPFDGLPWLVLYHAFGAHVAAYYCLLFMVEYACSIMLFLVVHRLFGDWFLALATALLWMVYPSDPSNLWLTTFAYRFGGLFFLSAVWLLLRQDRRPASVTYWAAWVCCVLGLVSNELYLGFIALLPLFAGWEYRQSLKLAALRATPFVLAIAAYMAYLLTRVSTGGPIANCLAA
jgi:hypothetical protein